MSFLDKHLYQDIYDIISNCNSIAESLRLLGVSATSSINRAVLSQYIKDNGINTSHFSQISAKYSPKDIFIEQSKVTQTTLRKYYKDGNYSEYKCAICGLPPFWNGQELVLTLDHINGVNDDHRLENLRWICPNCDLQLPTHGSKRLKINRKCKICGKELSGKTKTGLCKDCYCETVLKNSTTQQINNTCKICGTPISKGATHCTSCHYTKSRKTSRPEPLVLAKMIKETGFEAVGKTFGVNGNTIKKWCKSYNIPHTKNELVNWYNAQMGIKPESPKYRKTINEIIRPIHQIDKNTHEILNTFSSQAEALRFLGKPESSHINEVCRGLRNSAYGYYWEYA